MILKRLVMFLFCLWFLAIALWASTATLGELNEFLESGLSGHAIALAINATYALLAFVAAYWCAFMVQWRVRW